MPLHYFIWNGTNTQDKHIQVANRVPVVRPEERVQHVTIPGRVGELTVTEGDQIYNSYIQTAEVAVDGKANVHEAENWLKGEGLITFDTEPNRQQKARIIGAVTLDKHSKNMDRYSASVQFYCEPVKSDPDEEDIEVTESGATITNPGDLNAYPLIKITGSGQITLSCGGNVLTIPECVSGWTVDCENEWILDGGTPLGGVCSGAFPVFVPGVNTLAFTGSITKLEITPRFRYL